MAKKSEMANILSNFDGWGPTEVAYPIPGVYLSRPNLTVFRRMRLLISWYFKRPVMY